MAANIKRITERIIFFLITIIIFTVCFAFFLSLDAYAEQSNPKKEVSYVTNLYNDRNGLPTSEANVVIQSSDGYIWIGSYGGLVRYDGENFINYSEEGGFPSSSVRSILESKDGTLWIGTNDKGVFSYNGIDFTQVENPDNLFLCVRYLLELPDGSIAVCGNEGIAFIENGILHALTDDRIYDKTVYCAAIDNFGRLWLDNDDGITVIKDKEILTYLPSEFFFDEEQEYVYTIVSDSLGNIYIGSNKTRLLKISLKSEEFDYNCFDITTYNLNIGAHNNISVAEDGTICVGGLYGAAIISADGSIESFDTSQYAEAVTYMIKDDIGCYWLTSSNLGLVKYTAGRFYVPKSSDGKLETTAVNSVIFKDNYYYIGHDDGLQVYDNDWNPVSEIQQGDLIDLLAGHRVRHIITDNQNNLWFAVLDIGVVCYNTETGTIIQYTIEDGLSDDQTRVVQPLSDGSIAAGGREGVDIIQDGKVIKHYGTECGMENTIILSLLEMDDGTLLAGTDGKGIYALENGKATHYGYNEGLSDGVVLRMTEDDNGLFVSAGSNLYYGNLHQFTMLENFNKESGSILDLFIKDDMLWILQNSGLLRIDKNSLLQGEQAATVLYTFEQGLSGSLVANTWSSELDDKLYIPTRNGVSIFDFNYTNEVLPKGVINYARIDDEIIFNPTNITIPSNTQRITISFAALNYKVNADTRIAYTMEGFDSEEYFVSDKCSESVSYTNLPGGEYTFKFRVYSLINPENSVTYKLQINKDKTLTETLWFQLLILAAIIGFIASVSFLINKMRLYKAQKSKEQYKSIVEDALKTFANTIDAKDPYTNGHSYHVAMYSRELAKRMGMDDEAQEQIYYKALLHDIGKIGVPDHILKKPGRLDADERKTIEQHVTIGAKILEDFKALKGIADGAKYHHERFDGKGYENHLSGNDIPLEARIIAVADTYDAMASDRCYRKALSNEIIREELIKSSGNQLDPDITNLMVEIIDDGLAPIKDN